jgi:hypothetical protein
MSPQLAAVKAAAKNLVGLPDESVMEGGDGGVESMLKLEEMDSLELPAMSVAVILSFDAPVLAAGTDHE